MPSSLFDLSVLVTYFLFESIELNPSSQTHQFGIAWVKFWSTWRYWKNATKGAIESCNKCFLATLNRLQQNAVSVQKTTAKVLPCCSLQLGCLFHGNQRCLVQIQHLRIGFIIHCSLKFICGPIFLTTHGSADDTQTWSNCGDVRRCQHPTSGLV